MGEKRHADAPAAAFPRAARGILARLEALPAGLFAAGCKFSTKRRVAGLVIVGQKGRLLHRRQDTGRAPAAEDMHSPERAPCWFWLDRRLGFRLWFWNYWGRRSGKN